MLQLLNNSILNFENLFFLLWSTILFPMYSIISVLLVTNFYFRRKRGVSEIMILLFLSEHSHVL